MTPKPVALVQLVAQELWAPKPVALVQLACAFLVVDWALMMRKN